MRTIKKFPEFTTDQIADLQAKIKAGAIPDWLISHKTDPVNWTTAVEANKDWINYPCWLFAGKWSDGKGFKKFKFADHTLYVHRTSCEVFNGPVGLDQLVDHLCRVRGCCQPAHLEAVPPKVNIERGANQNHLLRNGAPPPVSVVDKPVPVLDYIPETDFQDQPVPPPEEPTSVLFDLESGDAELDAAFKKFTDKYPSAPDPDYNAQMRQYCKDAVALDLALSALDRAQSGNEVDTISLALLLVDVRGGLEALVELLEAGDAAGITHVKVDIIEDAEGKLLPVFELIPEEKFDTAVWNSRVAEVSRDLGLTLNPVTIAPSWREAPGNDADYDVDVLNGYVPANSSGGWLRDKLMPLRRAWERLVSWLQKDIGA